ncbi:hypothetical protein K469DRAFT_750378 [Zopfia rhizophila CBS 207.26]|uniref:F-box domain-containing protein n=1 Tax=Zopfia rhizophila CBS 207.26 TaxID=1314779 RepID=A0A6A6DZS0_9PEZI|nr:hypothetical protein K469DRAFT_750378 [Zopfia rhizophila CBS 207.26]
MKIIEPLPPQTFEFITTYADAVRNGNALLVLPREIRDQIYELVICTDEENHIHEPGVKKPFRTPSICQVNSQVFEETVPVFLQNTLIVLTQPEAPIELKRFMKRLPRDVEFKSIRKLASGAPHITKIIPYCTNITSLTLRFHSKDLAWDRLAHAYHDRTLDTSHLAWKFNLKRIMALRKLEKLTLLFGGPIETRLFVRSTRFSQSRNFWGLADWFRIEFRKKHMNVEVLCPEDDDIYSYN